jgi:predicted ATP-grasp superfamily ATP-dependent carboligase
MKLYEKIAKNPIFYVTRDIERALGIEPKDGYFIISNETTWAKKIAQKYPKNIFLLNGENKEGKEGRMLDTFELLQHLETKKFIAKHANIIVFKNNAQIENICRENNWRLLNVKNELAEKIESKISQIEWLGDLQKYLPEFEVGECKDISWNETPFIMQFNHGHTGQSTLLVENEKQLKELQNKFPKRQVKKSQFLEGNVFTNNNIVMGDKIFQGNISLQITGLAPFTDNKFSTIGNDWALPHKILTPEQFLEYKKIADDIGEKMMRDGWKGLFGLDILIEEKTGKLFLLEINARQPASAVFESKLQKEKNPSSLSVFEAHIMALLDIAIDMTDGKTLTAIANGAQIVQRITSNLIAHPLSINEKKSAKMAKMSKKNFSILEYENTEINADKYRIQSFSGIMKSAKEFNERGKFMVKNIYG